MGSALVEIDIWLVNLSPALPKKLKNCPHSFLNSYLNKYIQQYNLKYLILKWMKRAFQKYKASQKLRTFLIDKTYKTK